MSQWRKQSRSATPDAWVFPSAKFTTLLGRDNAVAGLSVGVYWTASGRMRRTNMIRSAAVLLLLLIAATAAHGQVVFRQLNASLDTGSLAGTTFPVSFSYDSSQVSPSGDSYVQLTSFDFTLLGVQFTRNDIFQGGQAIFHDGVLNNVTASFQVILPPNSPVSNITFGFGGPGVIGYADLQNQFGDGSFTIVLPLPGCAIQLNQTTFVNGDQVIAQIVQVTNPSSKPQSIEFKLWFKVPQGSPISFANGGADGSVVLPAGFNRNVGPLSLFTVTSGFSRGAYALNCTFLDPVTGAPLVLSGTPFTIQ